MPTPGESISHYVLDAKIGQGGMGEVWQATDQRLDRQVAIKFLPQVLTHEPERLDRFSREAKLLASLNHAGIATIFDVDEHQGQPFLVMELVPGEDLAQIVQRGPMAMDDALRVALQVAEAVHAAHEQGVVHRDLKPANVKLAPDGSVKVLDFGLAKTLEPDTDSGEHDLSMSPTITSPGTLAGVILGTAAYMSPEQARGRPVDRRTDLWSFGVLLYELLTGDNPFRGDTVADSVGAIMHRDLDLDALPQSTPAPIRRLLRRCLTRERDERLHDIADARLEIREALAGSPFEATPFQAEAAAPHRSVFPWFALAVLIPIAGLLGWWLASRAGPVDDTAVRSFELVADLEVDEVDISPDGTRLAYRVDGDLFIRSLDGLEAQQVAEVGSSEVFWSPDGRSLGIASNNGEIKRLDLDGGAPRVLLTLASPVAFATWSDDGFIYFATFQSGIRRIPESGGAAEDYLDAHETMLDYHGFTVLPGTEGVVLTAPHLDEGDSRRVFAESPGMQRRLVFETDAPVYELVYAPSGHLLYQRSEDPKGLWAVPFSASRLEVTGDPFLVVPDLSSASVSERGDLVYRKAAIRSLRQEQRVAWWDRGGEVVERVDVPVFEARSSPVPSPDGTRIALVAAGVGRGIGLGDDPNLWVIDLERQTSVRLTDGGCAPAAPVWSSDGTRIAYLATAGGTTGALQSIRADGAGRPEALTGESASMPFDLVDDWSLAALTVGSLGGPTGFDIVTEPVGRDGERSVFAGNDHHDLAPKIHPDGNWLLFASGVYPAIDTMIRPFPDGDGRWKVSAGNGGLGFWAPEGDRIYYFATDFTNPTVPLMEVSFEVVGGVPRLGRPVELFTFSAGQYFTQPYPAPGGRFVVIEDVEPEGEEQEIDTTGVVLVENWLSRFAD